jgi:hypothetical protein
MRRAAPAASYHQRNALPLTLRNPIFREPMACRARCASTGTGENDAAIVDRQTFTVSE